MYCLTQVWPTCNDQNPHLPLLRGNLKNNRPQNILNHRCLINQPGIGKIFSSWIVYSYPALLCKLAAGVLWFEYLVTFLFPSRVMTIIHLIAWCWWWHCGQWSWDQTPRHIFINISEHFVTTSLSEQQCTSSSLIPAHPRLAVNLAEDTTLYNCHEAAIVSVSPSANPGSPIYLQTWDKSALLAQHREDQWI